MTKKLSKEDLTRLAEKVRAELGPQYLNEPAPHPDDWVQEIKEKETKAEIDRLNRIADWEKGPIEKENQEGLRIGKYGNLPTPAGETPAFTHIGSGRLKHYTGFRFTEDDKFVEGLIETRPENSEWIDWSWSAFPWYVRALGLLRLPYDVGKFIVTGRLIVIPWPWRW